MQQLFAAEAFLLVADAGEAETMESVDRNISHGTPISAVSHASAIADGRVGSVDGRGRHVVAESGSVLRVGPVLGVLDVVADVDAARGRRGRVPGARGGGRRVCAAGVAGAAADGAPADAKLHSEPVGAVSSVAERRVERDLGKTAATVGAAARQRLVCAAGHVGDESVEVWRQR